MVGQYLASLGFAFDSKKNRIAGAAARRRSRNRIPLTESLEEKVCLSTVSAVAANHAKHLVVTAHQAGQQHSKPLVVHHETKKVAHLAKPKKLQTIYVRPGGKMNAKAGKTPVRPLGSINKALKLIKPGGTIILAAGVYTENVVISQKANISIIGAANNGSIIAPGGGDGIKVALSDNITIQNVWLRSSQGRGMAVMGASVNLQNIRTDGTRDDGVVSTRYQGRGATLSIESSHFDAVQLGAGLNLQGGSSATINNSTFNGVGTSPNATQASNGLVLSGDASANITNSQFVGNKNGGLVALENSHVIARGSTFTSNKKGNGALFIGSSTADLQGNTFASNGEVYGPVTGLNGLEFLNGFSGNAFVSGNTFVNNTANGIYIGGATNTIQVVNNIFDNNYVGITMDTATGTTANVVVQGNVIRVPVGTSRGPVGILAIGRGLTATIGGDAGLGNTLENFVTGTFIYIADGNGDDHSAGFPNLTILSNSYTSNGRPVSPSNAIHR